jgi:hypothetical protein
MMTCLVGLYDGLNAYFAGVWSVSPQVVAAEGAEGFKRHLSALESLYGYPVLYSRGAFQQGVQVLLSARKMDDAQEVAPPNPAHQRARAGRGANDRLSQRRGAGRQGRGSEIRKRAPRPALARLY